MQIGDEITWREMVRTKSVLAKRVRFFTGVIVGERAGKAGREFEIAVRFLSGNLPTHPRPFVWVSASELLMNRMIGHRHVNKVSPLDLIRRQVRQQARKELDIILANVAHPQRPHS
jgi:hypothetical protein